MKKCGNIVLIILIVLLSIFSFSACNDSIQTDGVCGSDSNFKMRLATSTTDFKQHSPSFKGRVEYLSQTPFKYIDVGFAHTMFGEGWRQQIEEVKAFGDSHGLKFVQGHAGDFSDWDNPSKTHIEELKSNIEACSILGIRNLVIHSQIYGDLIYPDGEAEFNRRNKDLYMQLLPTASEFGVNLCIENSAEQNMGVHYFYMTGADMARFIDYVNHPNLKAVWDVGHAKLRNNNQYDDIVALGDRLACIHFHDNSGYGDEHLAPNTDVKIYSQIFEGLKEINYNGYFTLECDNYLVWGCETFTDEQLIARETNLYYQVKGLLNAYNAFKE